MATITDLPNELIQLIAGRCNALDIIALSRTCRRLNKACDSAAALQMSFKLHLPEVKSAAFKDNNALVRFIKSYVDGPRKPCQRNDGSKLMWLCLAVAVSRLSDIPIELERLASSLNVHATLKPPQMGQETREALRGSIAFIATLPIWGCAEVCDAKVAALLDYMCSLLLCQSEDLKSIRIDQSLGGEHPLQFAFALVMSNLKQQEPSKIGDLIGDPRSVYLSSTSQLLAVVRANYGGREMGSDYDKFQASWIGKQTHALLIQTFICRNIYYQMAKGAKPSLLMRLMMITRSTTATAPTWLPNPNKIEFLGPWYFDNGEEKHDDHATSGGVMSLRPRFPLLAPNLPNLISPQGAKGRYFYPFAGDEWWSWYTTRVRDLVKRLDEGEWYGTYTYDLQLGSRIDHPMEGIRFRKTKTDGDKYEVSAQGCRDGVNTFNLSGEVDGSDTQCRVQLLKRYPTHQFTWDGLVTPLGICGRWDSAWRLHASRPAGYFWLWKREWTDADTVVPT